MIRPSAVASSASGFVDVDARVLARPRWSVDRLVYALACLFVASVPLLNAVSVPAVGSVARLTGVPFGVMGGLTLLLRGPRRRLTETHALAFGLCAWIAASSLWSIEPDASVSAFATMAQLVLMVVLLWEFASTPDGLAGVFRAFVIGAYAVLGILFWSLATSTGDAARYSLPGSHPNSVSFVLALGIPVACYLAATENSGPRRLLFGMFVPLAIAGTLLTGSRSALVTVGVALLMVPVAVRRLSRSQVVAGAVLVAVAAAIAVAAMPSRPLGRLASFGEEFAEGGLNGRTTIWEQSLEVMAERPLIGVGAGAGRFALERIRGAPAGPHNTLLSVAVDLGIIGMVLFAATLASAIVRGSRARGAERRLASVLALTLLVGLVPRHWEYERPTWLVVAFLLAIATQRDRPMHDVSAGGRSP